MWNVKWDNIVIQWAQLQSKHNNNFCATGCNQAGEKPGFCCSFFHFDKAKEQRQTLPLNINCSLIVATTMLVCALNGYINLVK